MWSTTVVGAERVPRQGPVILAANHIGVVDGPLVHGCAPRGTHVLVKVEMFRGPVGAVLRAAGQIPVDRRNGRPALTAALAVLRRGGAVGIFPEGVRGRGDASSARAGVAWLAVASGAPVVPVAVLGTRRTGESVGHLPGLRRRLVVEFGEPVSLTDGEPLAGRQAVARAHERVGAALRTHVRAASERAGVPLPTDGPAAEI
ncbi:lysophospholipid acyltransferase family protein [Actinotalea soli]|uniref:lysophospholipid acyltransferase family protein n=1 Tax=Actinotalea soli TaxID=2819234 RepID=UPI0027DE47A4|nr:lysophospholipid acyltransferase family protein [Actinotalea soli]